MSVLKLTTVVSTIGDLNALGFFTLYREFEPHSGNQVSKKQNIPLAH